jgi:large subunit ribosomal protein L1
MGKIRVKALGDEDAEKKQKEEARKRAEAKKLEKKADAGAGDDKQTEKDAAEAPKAVSSYAKKAAEKNTRSKRSTKYQDVASKVDGAKFYSLDEALKLLPQLKLAKFDETVELHINTVDKGISGSVTLPHGTGKQLRIVIANPSTDAKAIDELVKNIESGVIDFDVLLATPDAMPKLARVARFLGPRGLMPNPKNGTVTPKPEEAAKKFAGGQVNYKTEAKFPLLHMIVGKVSFGEDKLAENVKTAIEAVQMKNIKTVTLKSTMSPGIKLDTATVA